MGKKGIQTIHHSILKDMRSIIIEFSKSGEFMVIYDQDSRTLWIYKSTDLDQCFQDIEN
jgi:hypothetical protein